MLTTLREAGGVPEDLVSITIYLTDIPDYQAHGREIGAAWRELAGPVYPAMAGIGTTALWQPEALIEILGVAVIPDERLVRRAGGRMSRVSTTVFRNARSSTATAHRGRVGDVVVADGRIASVGEDAPGGRDGRRRRRRAAAPGLHRRPRPPGAGRARAARRAT